MVKVEEPINLDEEEWVIELNKDVMNDDTSGFPTLRRNDADAAAFFPVLGSNIGTSSEPDEVGVYLGSNSVISFDPTSQEYTVDISETTTIDGKTLKASGLELKFVFTVSGLNSDTAAPEYETGKFVLNPDNTDPAAVAVRGNLTYKNTIAIPEKWFTVTAVSPPSNVYDDMDATALVAGAKPYGEDASTGIPFPYYYKSGELEDIQFVKPDAKGKMKEGNFVVEPKYYRVSGVPNVVVIFWILVVATILNLALGIYSYFQGGELPSWAEHAAPLLAAVQFGGAWMLIEMLNGNNSWKEPVLITFFPALSYIALLIFSSFVTGVLPGGWFDRTERKGREKNRPSFMYTGP